MPTPTYDLIEEKVLGSAQASVSFTSIPGTYKDLVLEHFGTVTSGSLDGRMRFNGDTGSNYSRTFLYGDGSSAVSGRGSNATFIDGVLTLETTMTSNFVQIMSYANTNVNKTVISRASGSSRLVVAIVGLWRSTAAITSLELFPNVNQFATGTTFRLWGVSG